MVLDRFRLDDRVAIVTGAGRGIGAAVAAAYAEAGADVVVGARTGAQLAETVAVVEQAGRRAVAVTGDLTDRTALAELVDAAVDAFGGVDLVVNNVGGAMPQGFLDTSEAAFDAALHFNVTTAFNLTQLAVPHMLGRAGAAVLNITSMAGRQPNRGFAAYGTAKAALSHLTRQLAQDLAPRIRVNAIAPGAIATSALEIVTATPELQDAIESAIPMGRIGDPSEVAATAVFLGSPAASYITGEVLGVSGGTVGPGLDLGLPDL